jgi:hypothetical protein
MLFKIDLLHGLNRINMAKAKWSQKAMSRIVLFNIAKANLYAPCLMEDEESRSLHKLKFKR